MTPTSVKQYLQQRGTAPMMDVVNRFDAEPAAVAAVLDFWIRKGRLRHIAVASENASACGSSSCGSACSKGGCTVGYDASKYAMADLFEWVEREADAPALSLDALVDYQRAHASGGVGA